MPILLVIISLVIAVYIVYSKNLRIIASIQPERIPKKLVSKVSICFSISLTISTVNFATSIYFAEVNILVSLIFLVFGFLALMPFYYYYHKVKK